MFLSDENFKQSNNIQINRYFLRHKGNFRVLAINYILKLHF